MSVILYKLYIIIAYLYSLNISLSISEA